MIVPLFKSFLFSAHCLNRKKNYSEVTIMTPSLEGGLPARAIFLLHKAAQESLGGGSGPHPSGACIPQGRNNWPVYRASGFK